MAEMYILRKERLTDFSLWLQADGWVVEEPKGNAEVFRARKAGRKEPLSVYRKKGYNVTYSVPDRFVPIVQQFLSDFKWAYAQKKSGIGVNSKYHFT